MHYRGAVVMGPQLTGLSKINARQEEKEEVEEEKKEN